MSNFGGLVVADDSSRDSDGDERIACGAGDALSGNDLIEVGVREEVSRGALELWP